MLRRETPPYPQFERRRWFIPQRKSLAAARFPEGVLRRRLDGRGQSAELLDLGPCGLEPARIQAGDERGRKRQLRRTLEGEQPASRLVDPMGGILTGIGLRTD